MDNRAVTSHFLMPSPVLNVPVLASDASRKRMHKIKI